jgi:hypothetical protein
MDTSLSAAAFAAMVCAGIGTRVAWPYVPMLQVRLYGLGYKGRAAGRLSTLLLALPVLLTSIVTAIIVLLGMQRSPGGYLLLLCQACAMGAGVLLTHSRPVRIGLAVGALVTLVVPVAAACFS